MNGWLGTRDMKTKKRSSHSHLNNVRVSTPGRVEGRQTCQDIFFFFQFIDESKRGVRTGHEHFSERDRGRESLLCSIVMEWMHGWN